MTLKLVIHAPTAAALTRARRNLRNLLAAEPTAEVELVANAEAARVALAEPDFEADARLLVCQNSLDQAGLTAPAEVATVGAAIQHIARRQAEGWSYFRA